MDAKVALVRTRAALRSANGRLVNDGKFLDDLEAGFGANK